VLLVQLVLLARLAQQARQAQQGKPERVFIIREPLPQQALFRLLVIMKAMLISSLLTIIFMFGTGRLGMMLGRSRLARLAQLARQAQLALQAQLAQPGQRASRALQALALIQNQRPRQLTLLLLKAIDG
jgi:hypothetical protein